MVSLQKTLPEGMLIRGWRKMAAQLRCSAMGGAAGYAAKYAAK
jgi:hypothetical protein